MKKIALIFAAASISFGIIGCSAKNNGLNPKNYQKQSFELSNGSEPGNAKNHRTAQNVADGRFGFVRVHEGPDGKTPGRQPNLDYEDLADKISRLAVNLPDVHDVATLVTSRDVLIGYRTDSSNRKLTAHQVKNTAMAVVPRFYHIYLTDDPNMIKNIARFRDLPPNSDVQEMLGATIDEMKKESPQGPKMGPNENPNGEPLKKNKDTKAP